ncbi:MAG: hypothetical protein R3362_04740 [Rhodothermales bacterium]|nr:hypothetical protein [Rhodothermales bacterium]
MQPPVFDRIDRRIAGWMQRYGIRLLRYAVAVVFIWFGALKLFPGASPAEGIVRETVYWFDFDAFFPILGVWEVLIGLFLLIRPMIRAAIFLLFLQMPGTFLPLVLVPEACFSTWPFEAPWDVLALTLEGQYIVKNLVLITAALVVGGTVRHVEIAERKV